MQILHTGVNAYTWPDLRTYANFVEDVLKPPGSLLATDRSKAVVLVWFLLNVFGVGVSCRKLYSFVVYLYVDGRGSITSVGEERAYLSGVVYL